MPIHYSYFVTLWFLTTFRKGEGNHKFPQADLPAEEKWTNLDGTSTTDPAYKHTLVDETTNNTGKHQEHIEPNVAGAVIDTHAEPDNTGKNQQPSEPDALTPSMSSDVHAKPDDTCKSQDSTESNASPATNISKD